MLLDIIHGIIDRRILLNYHVEPQVFQQVLRPGFRPKVFRGKGIGGVLGLLFLLGFTVFFPVFCSFNVEERNGG
jgi:hypothetical protein